jgi:undecaprenyl-diphosphatase
MTWWQAAILGLIQGIAEFLPISSSGHLVLGQYLLGLKTTGGVTFEVFVHFGTVLSIVTVYYARIGRILKEAFTFRDFEQRYHENEDYRFAVFILITLVATGIIYLLFGEQLEALFESPRFVCGMLLVTGLLLLLTLFRRNPEGDLNPLKVVLIGLAQGAALTPGISRSGATICTALYQGVENRKAADFSFLMSLPAIVGATAISAIEVWQKGTSTSVVVLLVGTLVAYVSGVLAIRWMIDLVSRGHLHYFAFYVFLAGGLGLYFI